MHDEDLERLLARIEWKIDSLNERIELMAVDEATFDAALAAYVADVDAGVAALVAKVNQQAPVVDLSAELATINAAKSTFDTAVAGPPAPVDTTGVVVGAPSGPNPPDANEQAALDAQAAASVTVAPDPPAVSPPADSGTPADGSPAPAAPVAADGSSAAPVDPPAPPV